MPKAHLLTQVHEGRESLGETDCPSPPPNELLVDGIKFRRISPERNGIVYFERLN